LKSNFLKKISLIISKKYLNTCENALLMNKQYRKNYIYKYL